MASLERTPSSIEPNALLKDLYEKKQSIRRIATEVGSMASELRDVRTRMTMQELNLQQETARRQAAEANAEAMERELKLLQRSLEEKEAQGISTAGVAEQYLRELVDGRAKLGTVREAAESKATSADTAQSQCKAWMEELEMKNKALFEQEANAIQLTEKLADLHQEVRKREGSQKLLKEEAEKMEVEMRLAVTRITNQKESELRSALEDLTGKDAEHLVMHLKEKDEEIVRQREELRLLTIQLKKKARELDAQMDNHRSADQDLKKRVVNLEFWLRETRNQARKLQKIAEKKEKELKDLQAQLVSPASVPKYITGFWGSSTFKLIMSVSAVALFVFAKR